MFHPYIQRDFRRMGGVVDVVVGYTGGSKKNPTYQNIMDATEAVLVEYDPSIISYEKILNEVELCHIYFHIPLLTYFYFKSVAYKLT